MPSANESWGIEVGAYAIKAMHLQRSGKSISMLDYEVIPHKRVLTTPDIDADEAIRIGLDQFLSRHEIGGASVVVSVPGHRAFTKFARLPPVEPKRVPDIVKFEAVQQIPFPIEEVEWDYQTFQSPDSPDVEVGIFAITKERVNAWLNNFQGVQMPVHGLTLSPISVYNAMAYDTRLDRDAPGTIVMDIGTSATDLVIMEGERIWLRTIPIGGHHFTESLVRSFKLSYTKAEKIKREAGTSKYAKQIFQAMRPVFVDLVGEVQKSLGYYQSMSRESDLTRLIGLGNTFRLPGLRKFLKQQLQIDVVRLDRFERIEADGRSEAKFVESAPVLASAYGLALQGLEEEKVNCNVLPAELVSEQIWRAKQPWAAAAAVLVIAAAVLAYSSTWLDRRDYQAHAQTQQQIDSVINQAQSMRDRINQIESEQAPREKVEKLRGVLTYRNVWPMVLADLQSALASTNPQPALRSGDPEKIKSVPRTQRRQVSIESIESEYVYDANEKTPEEIWTEDGGAAELTPYEADSQGGAGGMGAYGMEYGPGPMMGGEGMGGAMGPGGPQEAELHPPSFRVTVIGTTPMADAARFLNGTLIERLQRVGRQPSGPDAASGQNASGENASGDAASGANAGPGGPGGPGAANPGGAAGSAGPSGPPNRPYRILSVDLKEVQPIPESRAEMREREQTRREQGEEGESLKGVRNLPQSALEDSRRGGRGYRGGGGGYGAEDMPPDYMGEMEMGMPGGMGGYPGGGGGRSSINIGDLEELMPRSPLAEEDDSTDSRFVIEFRVQLLPPAMARKADPDGEGQPTQPTQPTTPTTPAPAEPSEPVAQAEGTLP